MDPISKRSFLLLNGLWMSILSIIGATLLVVACGHLPLFWLGFGGSFAFGVLFTYRWYLQYRRPKGYGHQIARLEQMSTIGTRVLVAFLIPFFCINPINFGLVMLGAASGILATFLTGQFAVALMYPQPFYRQSFVEKPAVPRPIYKSWQLPLLYDLPVSAPISGGIYDFPFHFLGYDLFFTEPYQLTHLRCRVCDTLCIVKRDHYGPLSWRAYNRRIYQSHDSFACPHTNKKWHNLALELVKQIEQVEISEERQVLVNELRVLLRETKHIRW